MNPTLRGKSVFIHKISIILISIICLITVISGVYMFAFPVEMETTKTQGQRLRNLATGAGGDYDSGNPIDISSLTTETQIVTTKKQIANYWANDPMPIGPEFSPFKDINFGVKFNGFWQKDDEINLVYKTFRFTEFPEPYEDLVRYHNVNCSVNNFDLSLEQELEELGISDYLCIGYAAQNYPPTLTYNQRENYDTALAIYLDHWYYERIVTCQPDWDVTAAFLENTSLDIIWSQKYYDPSDPFDPIKSQLSSTKIFINVLGSAYFSASVTYNQVKFLNGTTGGFYSLDLESKTFVYLDRGVWYLDFEITMGDFYNVYEQKEVLTVVQGTRRQMEQVEEVEERNRPVMAVFADMGGIMVFLGLVAGVLFAGVIKRLYEFGFVRVFFQGIDDCAEIIQKEMADGRKLEDYSVLEESKAVSRNLKGDMKGLSKVKSEANSFPKKILLSNVESAAFEGGEEDIPSSWGLKEAISTLLYGKKIHPEFDKMRKTALLETNIITIISSPEIYNQKIQTVEQIFRKNQQIDKQIFELFSLLNKPSKKIEEEGKNDPKTIIKPEIGNIWHTQSLNLHPSPSPTPTPQTISAPLQPPFS